MTLPEQTVEIAVRCQVGRLQGTLFRIKPVPLSFWVTASIYSTFTVFQTTAKNERAIITLYNRMPFRLMSLSAVLYHCLKFQKGWFPLLLNTFSVLPKTNPSIPIHFQTFSYLNKASAFFFLKAAVSKEMSVLFF